MVGHGAHQIDLLRHPAAGRAGGGDDDQPREAGVRQDLHRDEPAQIETLGQCLVVLDEIGAQAQVLGHERLPREQDGLPERRPGERDPPAGARRFQAGADELEVDRQRHRIGVGGRGQQDQAAIGVDRPRQLAGERAQELVQVERTAQAGDDPVEDLLVLLLLARPLQEEQPHERPGEVGGEGTAQAQVAGLRPGQVRIPQHPGAGEPAFVLQREDGQRLDAGGLEVIALRHEGVGGRLPAGHDRPVGRGQHAGQEPIEPAVGHHQRGLLDAGRKHDLRAGRRRVADQQEHRAGSQEPLGGLGQDAAEVLPAADRREPLRELGQEGRRPRRRDTR